MLVVFADFDIVFCVFLWVLFMFDFAVGAVSVLQPLLCELLLKCTVIVCILMLSQNL